MKSSNPHYVNNCKISIKLLSLIISSFLIGCGGQKDAKQFLPAKFPAVASESAVNVNIASADELEKLPHIGEKIAQRIVEHREKFGSFRKAEHLLLVDGISDAKFREIRNSVKVE